MGVLESTLSEEPETFDVFVKLTEENRRERQRRIDAGDETAKIKFSPLAIQQPPAAKQHGGSASPAASSSGSAPAPKAPVTWSAGVRPGFPAGPIQFRPAFP